MGELRARADQRDGVSGAGLWAAVADEAEDRLAAVARALSGGTGEDAGCGTLDLRTDALTVRDACLAGGFDHAARMAAALADGIGALDEGSPRARPELVAELLSLVAAFGPVLDGIRAGVDSGAAPTVRVRAPGARAAVLLVDGAAGLREAEREILEGAGYTVRTAADGLAALAALRSSAVDLVLVDAELAGMGGIELTRAIRRAPGLEHIPVIVLAPHMTEEVRRRAARAGADGVVLSSAFARRELLGAAARVLDPAQR